MKPGAEFTLALSLLSIAALILILVPAAPQVHAQSQVALTASYSVVGGGSGYADLLNYTSNGATQIVPLTTTPTVYEVDAGAPWSLEQTLNGSTGFERWVTQSTDLSGTINTPLTVSYTYYHQYLINFKFNVTTGGGYNPPSVSFDLFGSSTTTSVGEQWVDAASSYSYSSTLSGATTGEQWLTQNDTGRVDKVGAVTVNYIQEFEITYVYSVLHGGSLPATPTLDTTVLGDAVQEPMSTTSSNLWAQPESSYSFTSSLSNTASTEHWIGTTDSGGTLTIGTYNGTLDGPISVDITYVNQYRVTTQFSFNGGDDTEALPTLSYQSFDIDQSTDQNTTLWVDGGTPWTVPQTINGPVAGNERWQLDNVTAGTFSAPTEISMVYFHQYFVPFSYVISGQPPTIPSGQPNLSYPSLGNAQVLTLATTPQSVWIDTATAYTATTTLSASTSSERWFATGYTGTVDANDVSSGIVLSYTQQYLVTVDNGGLPSEWVNAGSNVTLTVPAVFGQSAGIGYRAISYQLDGGPSVKISTPTATLSIELSMTAPHTISFQSVTQFEVILDSGATSAISSITPPTAPGDNYWYDIDSPVAVILSGAYGRVDGVGERLTSITISGQGTTEVDTVGTVQAFATFSLDGPVTITTTSLKQYEVVLNPAGISALASISPRSTFPNDTFWYDTGSPAVTVTLNGVFSRSDGTGTRLTSWELGSGGVNKVASSTLVSIITGSMTSPQFINATIATQYQVTLDSGATSALASITPPAILGDTGWYDNSTSVSLVLKGTWNRVSGIGERLASVSIDGTQQIVSTAGLVDVLTADQISQPEAITSSAVTQYEVTLDSGATAGLYSITPTSVSQDKYWYDSGTQVTVTLNGVWGRTATTGMRLVSYSVDKAAPVKVLSSSQVQVLSLASISSAQSVVTTTDNQYEVMSSPVGWTSITNATIPGDTPGWFDAGTTIALTYDDFWGQNIASRQMVTAYSVDGGKTDVQAVSNGNFTFKLSMTKAHTITLTSLTQYLLTVTGPSQVTAVPPSPTNDSYFDSGAKENFTVATTWTGAAPGTRYLLSSYSVDGADAVPVNASALSGSLTLPTVKFTGAENVEFGSITQYEVGFLFFDSPGAVPITASLIALSIGNATIEAQQPSWFANGTSFHFIDIVWEGADVAPSTSSSFLVNGKPMNVTLETRVYPASIRVVDLLGIPAAGAHVSMTLENDTTISGFTNTKGVFDAGLIPLGTYSAKVTNFGVTDHVVGDAASGTGVAVQHVALSLITILVIVAAAAGGGAGAFFLSRRAKRRGPKVSGPK